MTLPFWNETTVLDYMNHGVLAACGELGDLTDDDWSWRGLIGHVPITLSLLNELESFFGHCDHVVSVGAGDACVESLLLARGCKVTAVDADPPTVADNMRVLVATAPFSRPPPPWRQFMYPESVDQEEAHAAMSDANGLMLLWPTSDGYDDAALDEFSGDKLAVVLESRQRVRGDIGSDALWRRLGLDRARGGGRGDGEFALVDELALPGSVRDEWFPHLYLFCRHINVAVIPLRTAEK